MIIIVPPDAYRGHEARLQEMFRLRCRVFSERLGWTVDTRGGVERDQFDDLDPVYGLVVDGTDTVTGCWRLLPTTGRYMLRDVFSDLLDGEPAPRDPLLWEWSRLAIDGPHGLEGGLNAVSRRTGEAFCGLVEHCLAVGIETVVTVYDARIARLLPKIGCRPYKRTPARRIGGSIALAGFFEISPAVLAELRAANGITSSVVGAAPWLDDRRAA